MYDSLNQMDRCDMKLRGGYIYKVKVLIGYYLTIVIRLIKEELMIMYDVRIRILDEFFRLRSTCKTFLSPTAI